MNRKRATFSCCAWLLSKPKPRERAAFVFLLAEGRGVQMRLAHFAIRDEALLLEDTDHRRGRRVGHVARRRQRGDHVVHGGFFKLPQDQHQLEFGVGEEGFGAFFHWGAPSGLDGQDKTKFLVSRQLKF
jgi:hypothetical protein